jgi:hypothetical protein
MSAKPTHIQRWALLLVLKTARKLGRAPEPHEVCAHHKLAYPREAVRLKSAVRGLIRKGLIAEWPIVRTRPLRVTPAGRAVLTTST